MGGSRGAAVNPLCLFNVRTDDQTVIFNYTLQMKGIEQPSNPDTTQFKLFHVFEGKLLNNPNDKIRHDHLF